MTNAFNYLRSHRLMEFSTYPYTGKDGACQYNES